MFASSQHLHLELFCTHGTPVEKTLNSLPAFPIVISFIPSFEFSWETKKQRKQRKIDPFSALEHPDRIRVIDLTVPYTLFDDLAMAMKKPFPALTYLRLEAEDEDAHLPDTFMAGSAPRLQKMQFKHISFPAAPTILLSAHDLVEVTLREISDSGYIPPEAMVASLAALPRLKDLIFGFEWGTNYPNRIPLPVPPSLITRTVLPALTTFLFEGFIEYLEDLVAQIDAPQLDYLRIECRNQYGEDITDFRIPRLREFIYRSEKFKLSRLRRAHLIVYIGADFDIAINLLNQDQSSFSFRVSFGQGVPIGPVVSQLSVLFSNVDHLSVIPDYDLPRSYYGPLGHGIQWLELFRLFTAVKALDVHERISSIILLVLVNVTEERAAQLLPALELLCLVGRPVDSLEPFLTARQNVGRPVTVINEEGEFHERASRFDAGE
jgi:hypothetical protein